MTEVQRYPLQWPAGWKRTPGGDRKRASFGKQRTDYGPVRADGTRSKWKSRGALSVSEATHRLSGELRRLGVLDGDWLISSNLRVRLDGLPAANAAEPQDSGIAVYFRLGATREPRVLACDRWDRTADNIAAIAGHVDAIRAQERYGVGTLEQAFAGYAALPANTAHDWRNVFGFPALTTPTMAMVDEKFKQAARTAHPDTGGSHQQMARLNEARDAARRELNG